jgi:hypothetical protein
MITGDSRPVAKQPARASSLPRSPPAAACGSGSRRSRGPSCGSPAPDRPGAVDLSGDLHQQHLIDNDFFPLIPGTTFIYEGQTADGFEHVEFAVTHVTKMIANVNCVEVHDTRKVEGKVVEDTRDWFAQDNERNVWYFGENTTLVSDGLPVDLSGSCSTCG